MSHKIYITHNSKKQFKDYIHNVYHNKLIIDTHDVLIFEKRYYDVKNELTMFISDIANIIMSYYNEQIEVTYESTSKLFGEQYCVQIQFNIHYNDCKCSFSYSHDLSWNPYIYMSIVSDVHKMTGYVCKLSYNTNMYYKDMIAFLNCYVKQHNIKNNSFTTVGDDMMECWYDDVKYTIHNMYTDTYSDDDIEEGYYDVKLHITNNKIMKNIVVIMNMINRIILECSSPNK